MRIAVFCLCAIALCSQVFGNELRCNEDSDIRVAIGISDYACFQRLVDTPSDANARIDDFFPYAGLVIRRDRFGAHYPPKYLAHLLKHGLDPSLKWENRHSSQNLLAYAIWRQNDEAMVQLLNAGADVELDSGAFSMLQSPLQTAIANQNLNAVRELIAKGADVNRIPNENGPSPLIHAVSSGHFFITAQLIDAGAEIEYSYRKPYEIWPLISAARKGHVGAMGLLIDAGANVNRQSIDTGLTALHGAVSARSQGAIKLLLEAGAIPTLRSNYGRTPLEMAARNKLDHLF